VNQSQFVEILQAKCWHLKTSKEKHTNCG